MILSVALCTFNGGEFITEQLDSIINQTLKVNEIIICDDGSSDKTIEILKSYKLKYPELIKIYINNKSLGTIKNFEKAISICSGELIFLSDQDDIWCNNKVDKFQSYFIKNMNCKLLFSNGELIDNKGGRLESTLWDKWGFNEQLQLSWINNKNVFKDLIMNKNKITGATLCIHSSLKKNILPIRVPLGYWHDAFLGIHAAALNGLYFINESLIYYRVHKRQQVGLSSKIQANITEKSNPDFILKKKFYSILRKKHPKMKPFIPILPRDYFVKKIIKKIIKKIKRNNVR
nr:glycosyltransferase [uncultured Polaribacter sp.]